MSFNPLAPVDQRIAAWIELQRQAQKGPKSKHDVSITISREFGCEGFPLALQLKKDMEARWGGTWTIFDHMLLDKILEEKHVSLELLERVGERSHLLDSLISSLNPHWKTDQDLYEIMVETIHTLAQNGRAIFVGRGAAVVTQDLENTFHFRLEAPLEYRVNSLVRRSEMSVESVESLIKTNQDRRESFINHFLGVDLKEINFYHMKYNNAKIHNSEISASILQFMEQAVG